MSELPTYYDVTFLLPVTVRVVAKDEADAEKVAASALFQASGASSGAASIGFPESISVKEAISATEAVKWQE